VHVRWPADSPNQFGHAGTEAPITSPAIRVGTGLYGAKIFRPIIVVAIEIGGQGIRVPALVDSGADNALVPKSCVAPLGVDFSKLAACSPGA
jgi:hypothetical protein